MGVTIKERLLRRGPRKCAVDTCFRPTHQLSQWCTKHAQNQALHGSPTQRKISAAELKPHYRSVNRFLVANQGHPALAAAFAALDQMLANAAALPAPVRTNSRDWQARLRAQLQRLYKGGVTGETIFRRVAALHLFAHSQPWVLQPHSRPFWFEVARFTLNLRGSSVPTIKGAWFPTPARQYLGRRITSMLYPLLIAMTKALEQDASKRERAAIQSALASHPFTTTPSKKEEHPQ